MMLSKIKMANSTNISGTRDKNLQRDRGWYKITERRNNKI